MWRVIKQMGPAVFGVSIAQISLIINTIFASLLVAGSVSWLYYADRLMEFPSGLLGAALGYHPVALAFQTPCRQQHGGIFQIAGLGLAPGLHAHAARRTGAGHDCRAFAGDLLPAWRVRRQRCAEDELRIGRLQRRPHRPHRGESACSRFLRAARHQDAGQDRHRHTARHATDEPAVRIRAAICNMRVWRFPSVSVPVSTPSSCSTSCANAASTSPSRAGANSSSSCVLPCWRWP